MKTIGKTSFTPLLVILLAVLFTASAKCQSTEVQQLLLNVEKLTQLKNILEDMKKGYQVISQGYTAISRISQGNFSLHEVFIDGLMLVSPEIKKYQRVADIISDQKALISEYKTAFTRFKSSRNFNPGEIAYLGSVYNNLTAQSANNLDELLSVITSSKLRMSDDERLRAIDQIFEDTRNKLAFLRHFNREAALLNVQRTAERADLQTLQMLYNNEKSNDQ